MIFNKLVSDGAGFELKGVISAIGRSLGYGGGVCYRAGFKLEQQDLDKKLVD